MFVKVEVIVEVDVEAYNAEYGTDDKARDIREAIKSSVAEAAESTFAHLPCVKVNPIRS